MTVATDTIFRVETPEQMLALRDSARAGAAEIGFPGGLDPEGWARRWWLAVGAGEAIVLATGEGACIGGMLFDDIHNGHRVCVEGFWFVPQRVRDGRGLELLHAWESAARDAGAKRIVLGHHENERAPRMGRMYTRLGYAPLSHHYVKEV